MISVDEIEKTILELEQHDTTFATCEKLAWLYIIKDHLRGTMETPARMIETTGDSEFIKVCQGVQIEKVLGVLDEHMECVKTLYPREYDSIIEKIRE